MGIKDMLGNALKIATDTKFTVVMDDISSEMTYLELGLYLVSNSEGIERIEVILR